jgi:hypothetical protein
MTIKRERQGGVFIGSFKQEMKIARERVGDGTS